MSDLKVQLDAMVEDTIRRIRNSIGVHRVTTSTGKPISTYRIGDASKPKPSYLDEKASRFPHLPDATTMYARMPVVGKPYPDDLLGLLWESPHKIGLFDPQEKKVQTAQDNTNKMSDLFSNMPGMNLSFGKLPSGLIALSMNGELAFKDKSGNYVTIQKEGTEKTRVDVGSLKFDVDFYKIPTQDLEVEDIVLLDGELLQVDSKKNGDIAFVNPITGARTNKLKRSNLFGMYFYTKVVSLFNLAGGESKGLGLNGLDPMTLMLLSGQGGAGGFGGGDLSQLLILSQLTKGGNEMNPMMLMALTQNGSGSGTNDMMQFMLMSQAMGGGKAFSGGLFGAKKKAAPKAAPAKKAAVKPKKTTPSKSVSKG